MSYKVCTKCRKKKPVEEFYRKKTAKDGRQSWCRVCAFKYGKQHCQENKQQYQDNQRKWRRENPEKFKEYIKRYRQTDKYISISKQYSEKRKLGQYGLTSDDYNRMFEEQGGCCEICGRHQDEFDRRLAVDHDCETEKVRGLLCAGCNAGIGMLRHNKESLQNAIAYLDKYNG